MLSSLFVFSLLITQSPADICLSWDQSFPKPARNCPLWVWIAQTLSQLFSLSSLGVHVLNYLQEKVQTIPSTNPFPFSSPLAIHGLDYLCENVQTTSTLSPRIIPRYLGITIPLAVTLFQLSLHCPPWMSCHVLFPKVPLTRTLRLNPSRLSLPALSGCPYPVDILLDTLRHPINDPLPAAPKGFRVTKKPGVAPPAPPATGRTPTAEKSWINPLICTENPAKETEESCNQDTHL